MKIHLIFLAITQASVYAKIGHNHWRGRIIGGNNSIIEMHPYQVVLEISGCSRGDYCPACSGSIVDKNYVLTAGHCTKDLKPEQIRIRAGSTYATKGGIEFKVQQIINHPNFNIKTFNHDVALLKIHDMSKFFSNKIGIIRMARSYESYPSSAKISGWGLKNASDIGPTAKLDYNSPIQEASIKLFPKKTCDHIYAANNIILSENMLCGGVDDNSIDSCQGDSGGPVVSHSKLYAVISAGIGCGAPDGLPGVYASVAMHYDWIISKISM